MSEHTLKTWPQYFDAVKRGEKTFEVRRDDRGFQRGDTIVLVRTRDDNKFIVEYDRGGKVSHSLRFKIGWILTGGQFGVEPGYVVFSLEPQS